jgi:hypothetical protein
MDHSAAAAAVWVWVWEGSTAVRSAGAALWCYGPFGCADKSVDKHCFLICCERKILFRLKKQAEKYEL